MGECHPFWFRRCLTIFLILLLQLTQVVDSYSHAARVIELSDRFMDIRHEGVWLVKFYAPWCGHCKKLEPIFNHVAQALHDHPIRVAKVDCTIFTSIAQEYKISGYPTILLIKGEEVHQYRGDRTADEIVRYVKRMLGSPIQTLEGGQTVQSIFEKEKILFGFIGEKEGELWEAFTQTASAYQSNNHFLYLDTSSLPSLNLVEPRPVPFIFVHKEDGETFYPTPDPTDPKNLTDSLMTWVSLERFPTFLKITPSNFQDVMTTQKYIVMGVFEEDKLGRLTPDMERFRAILESVVARSTSPNVKSLFQFGWVGHPGLANSVAMNTLDTPSLLVINSSSFQHHIPEDAVEELTVDAILTFLEEVAAGNVYAYGGRSLLTSSYRAYYEGKTALVDMWRGNPILTIILFGLPLGFLSLIFYSICCSDILDSREDEDEQEDVVEGPHEKKE